MRQPDFSTADGAVQLWLGDALAVLAEMEAESIDAIVCDPPAGISFMGKDWDHDKGGRDKWVAWFASVMREALRLLKPGGHALVWALPRTSHWTGWALEDAGFEVRDKITHLYGQGFPKSLAIDKAIDKAAGKERERVVNPRWAEKYPNGPGGNKTGNGCAATIHQLKAISGNPLEMSLPATEAAKQWSGWGTALKPAAEDWWLVRKPLCGTVAENVLKHGCGGLNIDGTRIGMASDDRKAYEEKRQSFDSSTGKPSGGLKNVSPLLSPEELIERTRLGRWPANLVLSHSDGCVCLGRKRVKAITSGRAQGYEHPTILGSGGHGARDVFDYADPDGLEAVEAWECVEGCPVKLLDEQAGDLHGAYVSSIAARRKLDERKPTVQRGVTSFDDHKPCSVLYTDSGGPSRFFYTAKASNRERWLYCRDCKDAYPASERDAHAHGHTDADGKQTWDHITMHPTVKPLALMRWLCRLITPPGGIILDPFLGSGTTVIAAMEEGFKCIGIDNDPEYLHIAGKRLAAELHRTPLFDPKPQVQRLL